MKPQEVADSVIHWLDSPEGGTVLSLRSSLPLRQIVRPAKYVVQEREPNNAYRLDCRLLCPLCYTDHTPKAWKAMVQLAVYRYSEN